MQKPILERAPGRLPPPRGRESAEGGGEEEWSGLSGRDLPGLEDARSTRAQTQRATRRRPLSLARSPKEPGRAPQPPPPAGCVEAGGGGERPEAAVDATLVLAYVLPDPKPGGRSRLSSGQPEPRQWPEKSGVARLLLTSWVPGPATPPLANGR